MKNLLFSCALLFSASALQAQEPLQQAFSASYQAEAAGAYSKAVTAIQGVYSEKSYELNLRLAWLEYLNKDYVASQKHYQKAVELMPMSIEAKLGYVIPAAELGNWEQVIKTYQDILKIEPNNSTVNYRMGSIYYNRSDFPTALKYLERVVNLYPFNYDGVYLLAWTYLNLGKNGEAKLLFQRALLIVPNDANALDGLGRIK